MGHIEKTLSDYAKKDSLRLHMPGHKGTVNPFDNTEIPQTDDLNHPLAAYKKALDFVGGVYNSSKSFFLTNGATLGIQAMVLYAKKSGYKIIAMRNSHMSVINACLIFGAECEILNPEYDDLTDTYKSPSQEIIKYLNKTREKCVVILTSPDYYGRCVDIKEIKDAAAKKDVLVFCDSAHGAHFVYSDLLPERVGRYSDIWVHGAHKTLGALTQGAFAHCSSSIDVNMFGSVLRALNTSSPSHLIASSLEEAVLDSLGERWNHRAKSCGELEEKINSLGNMSFAGLAWAKGAGYQEKDITRVVIDSQGVGGGFYLYNKLYKEYNIQLEMADFRYAVAIMTIYDCKECDNIFFNALRELDVKRTSEKTPEIPAFGRKNMEMSRAWKSKSVYIKLEEVAGKVSASLLGAYPPGTALVLPGEMISQNHIDYFEAIVKRGGYIFGQNDGLIAIVDI